MRASTTTTRQVSKAPLLIHVVVHPWRWLVRHAGQATFVIDVGSDGLDFGDLLSQMAGADAVQALRQGCKLSVAFPLRGGPSASGAAPAVRLHLPPLLQDLLGATGPFLQQTSGIGPVWFRRFPRTSAKACFALPELRLMPMHGVTDGLRGTQAGWSCHTGRQAACALWSTSHR